MATTYLIKLETIQFDEIDCDSPLLSSGTHHIQYQDSDQFFKTLNANTQLTNTTNGYEISYVNHPTTCTINPKTVYAYDGGSTMQIVQLENPVDLQHTIEMSDSGSSSNATDLNTSAAINVCDKIKIHQRKLNKYVRIRFREEFGKEFLLTHDLHECDQEKFERLRKEALTLFKPPGVSERTAWARAKQSLRLMRNAMLKN